MRDIGIAAEKAAPAPPPVHAHRPRGHRSAALRAISLAQRFCLILLAALALGFWLASPATAHFDLAKSSPAAGAQVGTPVTEIRLTFTAAGTPVGTGFMLHDGAGATVPVTRESADGGRTWLILPAKPLDNGRFSLMWKVAAPDAHPMSGVLSFSVRTTTGAGPARPTGPGGEHGQHRAAPLPDPGQARVTQFVGVFGRWLCYGAALLGAGGLAFALTTLVGTSGDIRTSQTWVRLTGLAVVAGAAVEALALAAAFTDDGALTSAVSSEALTAVADTPAGVAVALRFVGAAGLLGAGALEAGLVRGRHAGPRRGRHAPSSARDHWELFPEGPNVRIRPKPTTADDGPRAEPDPRKGDLWLRAQAVRPVLLATTVAMLLSSFLFDGHTATAGPRALVVLADLAHTAAAAVWTGGVLLLAVLLVARARRGERTSVAEMAARFSIPATVAVVFAGAAGVMLATLILNQPSDLVDTDWGRVLLTKTALVAAVALVGLYNNKRVVPALNVRNPASTVLLRRTLTVEALLMLAVVLTTAILVSSRT